VAFPLVALYLYVEIFKGGCCKYTEGGEGEEEEGGWMFQIMCEGFSYPVLISLLVLSLLLIVDFLKKETVSTAKKARIGLTNVGTRIRAKVSKIPET